MKSPILSLTGQFYTGFPIFLSTHKTKSGMVGALLTRMQSLSSDEDIELLGNLSSIPV